MFRFLRISKSKSESLDYHLDFFRFVNFGRCECLHIIRCFLLKCEIQAGFLGALTAPGEALGETNTDGA